ncbi:MAG: nucleoside monophosphate kinase [bacterium]|nr:nucleoside monophosphate kinase [bacterium]
MAKVVMIYGQPGSGKGTQAYLLEAVRGFFHFDTGMHLEQVVRDPANKNNKKIQHERKLFDSGILLTPSWVLGIVQKKAGELAAAGSDLVFSGSPRTLFEAFGDSKNQGLIAFLKKAYGRKNMHFFVLRVSEKTSIWRNSHRLVCSTCGAPVLYHKNRTQHCPFCASPLRQRSLDKPDIIRKRLREYEERTAPILSKLKNQGFKINYLNGEPAPYKVFKNVLKKLESRN